MANLNVTGNFSTSSNTLNVRYTTDAQNITKMEITKDNTNFITADSFTNSNAVFDVSAWANGNYTCKLRMTYTEATPDPKPDPTPTSSNAQIGNNWFVSADKVNAPLKITEV